MRKILVLAVVVVTAFFYALPSTGNPLNRHCAVLVRGSNGKIGTGVIIPQGILTVAHVVRGPSKPLQAVVEFFNSVTSVGQVVALDESLDLALLDARRPPGIVGVVIDRDGVDVGDLVTVIGNGDGRRSAVKPAFVVDKEKGLLFLDGRIIPGDSGSPVLDKEGEVTGIVSYISIVSVGRTFIPSYCVAISSESILKFLNKYASRP